MADKYLVKNTVERKLTVHGHKGIPGGKVHVLNEALKESYKNDWGDKVKVEPYEPEVEEEEAEQDGPGSLNPSEYTGDEYDDLVKWVKGDADSVSQLQNLLEAEQQGKDRIKLQKAIQDRLDELSE